MKFVPIIKIKPIAGIVLLLWIVSCAEPDQYGFLSDKIMSKVDTIFVQKGVTTLSQAPAYDFSTRPYNFTIGDIRTEDGAISTQMKEPMNVRLWTDAFIPRVDITEADVMAKLHDTLVPPVVINPLTGVMQFTSATEYVDEADVFNIDLNVSNISGEKHLDNYVAVKLSSEGDPVKVVVDPYVYYILKGDNGKTHNGFNFILNTSEEKAKVIDGTGAFYAVNKLSDEPTIGIKVYLRLLDKNGEGVGNMLKLRLYDGWWLPHYGDNSVHTVQTDDGIEYNFPMTPWPVASYAWDVGLCYYHTYDFAMSQLDTAAMFTDPTIGDIPVVDRRPTNFESYEGFYLSLKFGILIMKPGTWEITVTLPFISK